MTTFKNISLFFTSLTVIFMLSACGSALDSALMGDMGLVNSGLSAGTDADLDESDMDLIEDEYSANVGLSETEVQGAQALDDEGLLDEEASLIGVGNIGPESIPVTLSKGDETAPPSEDCGEDSQGSFYIITDSLASQDDESQDEIAWVSHVFKAARADIVYVRTTLKELSEDGKHNRVFENQATEVYQCQAVTISEDGEDEVSYEWVSMDLTVVQDYLVGMIKDSSDSEESSKIEKTERPVRLIDLKDVIEKETDRIGIQPVFKIQANKFTGKKEVLMNRSFDVIKSIEK